MKTLFLLICLSFARTMHTQTLHFILAADTRHPMAEFAESCAMDSFNMAAEAKEMARGANFNLRFQAVCGPDFSANGLCSAVRSLTPMPDDVILLYISGAAECDTNEPLAVQQQRRWIQYGPGRRQLVSTDSLHAILQSKPARLTILILDACSVRRPLPAFIHKRGDAEPKAYRTLLSACGTLRVFSSQPSEYSYGDKAGGLFTNALLDGLDHFINIGDPNLGWKTLLEYAAETTAMWAKKIWRHQYPVVLDWDFREKCAP